MTLSSAPLGRAAGILYLLVAACGSRTDLVGEEATSSTSNAATVTGATDSSGSGSCADPPSASPDPGPLMLQPGAPYTTFQVSMLNKCSMTIWPAFGRTGGLDQTVPDPSLWEALAPGAQRMVTMHDIVDVEVAIWGRTRCSFDLQGKGKCATGDCGGFVCPVEVGTLPQDATIYATGIEFTGGYNVPMSVAASGCAPVQCEFNPEACPIAARVDGSCGLEACKAVCPSISSCCSKLGNGCFQGGLLTVTFCP